MKPILFPTDFSENSVHALPFAVEIARLLQTKLILFHAVRTPFADPLVFTEPVPYTNQEEAETHLQQLVAQFSPVVPCEYVVTKGAAVDEMGTLIRNKSVDLVIMATEGSTSGPVELSASTTVELIQKHLVPVIVIPPKGNSTAINKLAFAVDTDPVTDPAVWQPLVTFAQLFSAEVLVVTVTPTGKLASENHAAAYSQLSMALSPVKHSFHTVQHDNVAEGIELFVKQQQVQLLSLIARKHKFLESLFHWSITKRITMYTNIPLLVLTE